MVTVSASRGDSAGSWLQLMGPPRSPPRRLGLRRPWSRPERAAPPAGGQAARCRGRGRQAYGRRGSAGRRGCRPRPRHRLQPGDGLPGRGDQWLRIEAEHHEHGDHRGEHAQLATPQVGEAPAVGLLALEGALHHPQGVHRGEHQPHGAQDGGPLADLPGALQDQELGRRSCPGRAGPATPGRRTAPCRPCAARPSRGRPSGPCRGCGCAPAGRPPG